MHVCACEISLRLQIFRIHAHELYLFIYQDVFSINGEFGGDYLKIEATIHDLNECKQGAQCMHTGNLHAIDTPINTPE